MTREITHMRAFTLALESMGKPPFSIGKIAPTPRLVDQFLTIRRARVIRAKSLPEVRGTTANPGNLWSLTPCTMVRNGSGNGVHATSSAATDAGAIQELLVDQLREHAEKQLVKALQRWPRRPARCS